MFIKCIIICFTSSVCNDPPVPVDGTLVSNGTEAVYTCALGYTINGPSERACQGDGSGWSDTDPSCGELFNCC